MRSEVKIEPLREPHLEGLIDILWCPEVLRSHCKQYTRARRSDRIFAAIVARPGSAHEGEQWLNFFDTEQRWVDGWTA
ncbi:MAG: hypothetical protein LR015_08730 [Verrucomicrobia bacterium]|nr:hypothetical protein [Verrucomicrobiota bacterium]